MITAADICRLGMANNILSQLDLSYQPCTLAERLPRIKQESVPPE